MLPKRLSTEKTCASISSVDCLHTTLRLREAGSPRGWDLYDFPLTTTEFVEFEQLLSNDESLKGYYEDKVPYDWRPPRKASVKGQYVLQMSPGVHQRFVSGVSDAIWAGIKELANRLEQDGGDAGRTTATELRQVYCTGRKTLQMYESMLESTSSHHSVDEATESRRSPDNSFAHSAQPHAPALVVEVSCSNQPKDLAELAEGYIIDSWHKIRWVVGVDVAYQPPMSEW